MIFAPAASTRAGTQSVTELEFLYGALNSGAPGHAFFFFRDFAVLEQNSVSVAPVHL